MHPQRHLQAIRLRGVRQNNLHNIDVDFPVGCLTVVTGLSGTGKSSLVFETLHAEGQRRYAETFSPYVRQFMEMLDRPEVDSVDNIRPSIAIEQGNSVKTSRSTVGTMTELCDYFKVWFACRAKLYDPASGEEICDDNPDTIWQKVNAAHCGQWILIAFNIERPQQLDWAEIIQSLQAQGYSRVIASGAIQRIDSLDMHALEATASLAVIQDRVVVDAAVMQRFKDAVTTALHFGRGQVNVYDDCGNWLCAFSEGLHRPSDDRHFQPAAANLFSFNSPIGACPTCRGFGRIIETDDNLIIPDPTLSLQDGAIRPFSGAVYSESQRDLLRACNRLEIRSSVPWQDLSAREKTLVLEGEPDFDPKGAWQKHWYGVRRFFKWLEENTYKMHVRVFLSRYRSYTQCPACGSTRLQPESLCWRWDGYRLPDLYALPVRDLLPLMQAELLAGSVDKSVHEALSAIVTRLQFLVEVGLEYLTLDRSSRTLSGGETQRVNLTSCLGTSLVDTLFVMDEPSIGLHCRDIGRLIGVLRKLTDQGNTVVVVEHDEAVIAAADHLIELGPLPGRNGGKVIYAGPVAGILANRNSPTGSYLASSTSSHQHREARPVPKRHPHLRIDDIHQHNLRGISVAIPLQRMVVLSGVSGSGKSTLMEYAIHGGLLARSAKGSTRHAKIGSIELDRGFAEIIRVDASTVTRTPRSNPALFVGVWDAVRQLFAQTDAARQQGYSAAWFSFNTGQGRCHHCQGLGHERVEMQFMADVFVRCPYCDGKQFSPEILEIRWQGLSVADLLAHTIAEAMALFNEHPTISRRLQGLLDLGLGYLTLGQPLNTLSGGESQRLKLVRHLNAGAKTADSCLILLDEPTTGLHRADIARLLAALQRMVDQGHSLIIIEHHPDVIRAADWVIELGPEAGDRGGKVVFCGPPAALAVSSTATAPYVRSETSVPLQAGDPARARSPASGHDSNGITAAAVANDCIRLEGAREHNLQNISLAIKRHQMTVITGLSGSGKSTLAFDILFAEGQRRYLESMSAWARQYVEQLPKPDIDRLTGIAPSVAIEQRVTHGSAKSTVATITEVAQYLRLLYARIGVQISPNSGERLVALRADAVASQLRKRVESLHSGRKKPLLRLMIQLVRNRKGHHEPIANWARDRGYTTLRVDGEWVHVQQFKRLDRYREHTIELVLGALHTEKDTVIATDHLLKRISLSQLVRRALESGKGSLMLQVIDPSETIWFSTRRSDPVSGEAFPELDPKDFSWNAPRGWCTTCRGYGQLFNWMQCDERYPQLPAQFADSCTCPACAGERLNPVSRNVFLFRRQGERLNLPALLRLTPLLLLDALQDLQLDQRDRRILNEVLPDLQHRLQFLQSVGLDYLSMDRPTNTLSGGEAQRIRLAAQLGSNLTGSLYVLDEPSIGLHEQDNARLLSALQRLKERGNTLLVVEHDITTLKAADQVIDLGPMAGKHGGQIIAQGPLAVLAGHPHSLTGKYLREGIRHPLQGSYRPLPPPYNPHSTHSRKAWLVLKEPRLRNLKGGELRLPKGRLIGVCGISGSGKSTLIRDLLLPLLQSAIQMHADSVRGNGKSDPFTRLSGTAGFRHVLEVDQSPIGKTPRSTPATYIGAFDRIRHLFAQLPEARMRGLDRGAFSFNTKGGRCEHCQGAGQIKLEMSFMPDSTIPCHQCKGARYGSDLQAIRWNGKNIADVLQMTFDEAATFFAFDSSIAAVFKLMQETGLGYITLGQNSPTLSGGEAQRLKLVSELVKGIHHSDNSQRTPALPNFYLLEEPSIGLHAHDCERLIHLLHRLVNHGHTVVFIEHNLDLLAEADYLVEIGPQGGQLGGQILFQGTPTELVSQNSTPTAPFLSKVL